MRITGPSPFIRAEKKYWSEITALGAEYHIDKFSVIQSSVSIITSDEEIEVPVGRTVGGMCEDKGIQSDDVLAVVQIRAVEDDYEGYTEDISIYIPK